MTQAFNLGQLANKVNTSGQLDASTGLTNSVAVANGGTGRATLTAGTVLLGNGTSQVNMFAGTTTNDALIWSGTAWTSSPIAVAGGGGGYQLTSLTSPGSYTKPASLKAIKVTVVGAGGAGGSASGASPTGADGGGGGGGGASIYYAPAPSLPASAIPISAGTGTSSFGVLASATAGAAGTSVSAPSAGGAGGAGGVGTGGITFTGTNGLPGRTYNINMGGIAGSSLLGLGGNPYYYSSSSGQVGTPGKGYGGGGGGGGRIGVTGTYPGGTGSPGIVIIEEFF